MDEEGDDTSVDQRFARVMARVLDKKREDLRQHKAMVQKVDSGYEESIAQLRAREVKTSETFSHKRTTAGKAVARIKELVGRNKEIEGVMADDEYQQVQAELGELEQRMGADGAGQEDGEEETVRMSVGEKQRLLASLQADLLVLTEERKKYAHQSELITLIKHRHSQLSSLFVKHNQALAELIAANDVDDIKLPTVQPMPASTSNFTALYGQEYNSAQLQPLLEEAHDRVKSEWRAKERELSTHVNEQSRLAGQQKMLADESTALSSRVDRIRSQFLSVGEDEHLSLSSYKEEMQWDEEMTALQAKLVKLTADGQKAAVLVELYQKYLAKTAEDHKCQLCLKQFTSTEEEQFRERVESLVRQVSSEKSREQNEKKIAACKKRMKVMHDLTPLVHGLHSTAHHRETPADGAHRDSEARRGRIRKEKRGDAETGEGAQQAGAEASRAAATRRQPGSTVRRSDGHGEGHREGERRNESTSSGWKRTGRHHTRVGDEREAAQSDTG